MWNFCNLFGFSSRGNWLPVWRGGEGGGGGRGGAVLVSCRHHSYKHWAPHNSREITKMNSSIQPVFTHFYVWDIKCKTEFPVWLNPIFWITQSSQSRIRGFLFFRGKSRNRKAPWTLPFIWLAELSKKSVTGRVWSGHTDGGLFRLDNEVWTCFEGDCVYRYIYQYF